MRFENIVEDVEEKLRELMNTNTTVDAIFALNNHIAVAILTVLRKKGFEGFADVQIACFDDIDTFNLVDKKVISVSQPIEEIGKSSSTLLLDIISGKQTSKSNMVLSTKLVVR